MIMEKEFDNKVLTSFLTISCQNLYRISSMVITVFISLFYNKLLSRTADTAVGAL